MTTLTNERIQTRISKPTDLAGVLEAFDDRHLKKFKGRDMRYRRAKRFVDWCLAVGLEMNELNAWEIEGYLDDLTHIRGKKKGQPLAVTTVRGHAQVINTLLNYAERVEIQIEGAAFKAPKFKVLKAPKEEVKYLKDDQVDRVINDLESPIVDLLVENYHNYHKRLEPYNSRNLAFVYFLLETGARQSDALGLNWGDITWNEKEDDGSAYVRDGKGGKARMMFFGPVAWSALKEYVQIYGIRQGENDPVFCSIRSCWKLQFEGKPLPRWTSGGIAFVFNRLTKRLGFKVTPHMLRHTWADRKVKAGMHLRVLQKLGGWANLKLVERYTILLAEDLQESWRQTKSKVA